MKKINFLNHDDKTNHWTLVENTCNPNYLSTLHNQKKKKKNLNFKNRKLHTVINAGQHG